MTNEIFLKMFLVTGHKITVDQSKEINIHKRR